MLVTSPGPGTGGETPLSSDGGARAVWLLELGGLPSAATRRHRLRDASATGRRSVRRIFLRRGRGKRPQAKTPQNSREQLHELAGELDKVVRRALSVFFARLASLLTPACADAYRLDGTRGLADSGKPAHCTRLFERT